MHYQSTRDKSAALSASQAIAQGLAEDGGLFVPESVPHFGGSDLQELQSMDYKGRAARIMGMFLDDYTETELGTFAEKAYGPADFSHPDTAPVKSLDGNTAFLELWHGPTCAFKDMALQMLPYFLTASLEKTGESREVCILVATSGDTGKAALEGFRDVPRTRIMVFYPRDGVSDIQKLQMTTQSGNNVGVCSVKGNFDDAQTGVKTIFSDTSLRDELNQNGLFLSSANSINWGRLLPQIVYYVSAYCDLVNRGTIFNGDRVNFCVPTGNFGNILAGFYAKSMGLPIGRLICASNCNDVLTEFINTGVYNKNRKFYTTISPSMDILVSSNLERLIFELSGKDDAFVSDCMSKLARDGRYAVTPEMKKTVSEIFSCGMCTDPETKETINDTFREYGYLIDTHTAVAFNVLKKYRASTGDKTPSVVVSTASPFKFCDSVLDALGFPADESGPELIEQLQQKTGVTAPLPLRSLRDKEIRFNECVEKSEMKNVVRMFLSL